VTADWIWLRHSAATIHDRFQSQVST